jgi:hypothetical protein
MVTLYTHSRLRQIGHDSLPHRSFTEIIEGVLSRDAAIGTENKSNAFVLGEARFWCYAHQYLLLHKIAPTVGKKHTRWSTDQDSPRKEGRGLVQTTVCLDRLQIHMLHKHLLKSR